MKRIFEYFEKGKKFKLSNKYNLKLTKEIGNFQISNGIIVSFILSRHLSRSC
jgi:hypothetical protein